MKYLYIANWKMNTTFSKSINFCSQNHDTLKELSTNADIVLCPSFIALVPIIEIFKNSAIAIGAQNCSEYASGSYTGEVSAQSLKEIGVTYCIVGHSERRIHYGETSKSIANKIKLLYQNNIQPIICIGETKTEFNNKQTLTVLTQQLEPIIKSIHPNNRIIIAYEPVWAIGTGIIPEAQQLQNIFAWLAELFQSKLPNNPIQLLYGGSINPTNSRELKKISHINGFLIGSASTDFESFMKIITSIL
jgi:triosephosphate isomerase